MMSTRSALWRVFVSAEETMSNQLVFRPHLAQSRVSPLTQRGAPISYLGYPVSSRWCANVLVFGDPASIAWQRMGRVVDLFEHFGVHHVSSASLRLRTALVWH